VSVLYTKLWSELLYVVLAFRFKSVWSFFLSRYDCAVILGDVVYVQRYLEYWAQMILGSRISINIWSEYVTSPQSLCTVDTHSSVHKLGGVGLLSACMAFMGRQASSGIIFLLNLTPIEISAWTYAEQNFVFDNVPSCYICKSTIIFSSKLHCLFVTFLWLMCFVGMMDSYLILCCNLHFDI
jgi:hypothetical protein